MTASQRVGSVPPRDGIQIGGGLSTKGAGTMGTARLTNAKSPKHGFGLLDGTALLFYYRGREIDLAFPSLFRA